MPATKSVSAKKTGFFALFNLFGKTRKPIALQAIDEICKSDQPPSTEQLDTIASALKNPEKSKAIFDKLINMAESNETQAKLTSILMQLKSVKSFDNEAFTKILLNHLDSTGKLETVGLNIVKNLVTQQIKGEDSDSFLRAGSAASNMISAYYEKVINKNLGSQLKLIINSLPNSYYYFAKRPLEAEKVASDPKEPALGPQEKTQHDKSLIELERAVMVNMKKMVQITKSFPECLKELNGHIYSAVNEKFGKEKADGFVLQPLFLRFLCPLINKLGIPTAKAIPEMNMTAKMANIAISKAIMGIVNYKSSSDEAGFSDFFAAVSKKNPYLGILNQIKKNITPPGLTFPES